MKEIRGHIFEDNDFSFMKGIDPTGFKQCTKCGMIAIPYNIWTKASIEELKEHMSRGKHIANLINISPIPICGEYEMNEALS